MKKLFLILCAAVLLLPAGALANSGAMNGRAPVYTGPSRYEYGQIGSGIDENTAIFILTYVVEDDGTMWYHIMYDVDDGWIYGGYVEAKYVTAYGNERNEERWRGEDGQMLTDVDEVLVAPLDDTVSIGSVRRGQSIYICGMYDNYAIIEVTEGNSAWRGFVPEDTVITVREIEMSYVDD